jgi:hypothetical protein
MLHHGADSTVMITACWLHAALLLPAVQEPGYWRHSCARHSQRQGLVLSVGSGFSGACGLQLHPGRWWLSIVCLNTSYEYGSVTCGRRVATRSACAFEHRQRQAFIAQCSSSAMGQATSSCLAALLHPMEQPNVPRHVANVVQTSAWPAGLQALALIDQVMQHWLSIQCFSILHANSVSVLIPPQLCAVADDIVRQRLTHHELIQAVTQRAEELKVWRHFWGSLACRCSCAQQHMRPRKDCNNWHTRSQGVSRDWKLRGPMGLNVLSGGQLLDVGAAFSSLINTLVRWVLISHC